jgi:hypothetical protein
MDTYDDEDGEDDDGEQGVEGVSNFRRKGVYWCNGRATPCNRRYHMNDEQRQIVREILKKANEADDNDEEEDEEDDEEDDEVEVAIFDEMHSRRLAKRGRGPGTQHMLNLMRG